MTSLKDLITKINTHELEIDTWFDNQWKDLRPLPYFSCDIRHAPFKLGIVDTNLFPGGFNNLCNAFTDKTANALKEYFTTYHSNTKTIALLAENHTRNKFYLFNVLKIQTLLQQAGYTCLVTMPLEQYPQDKIDIALSDSQTLTVLKPVVTNGVLSLDGQDADIILSNNDFSSGLPADFKDLKTAIVPHPCLGWHHRKKSDHFKILASLTQDFGKAFNIDPWCLTPMSTVARANISNLEGLAEAVDNLIQVIQKKYEEYGINEKPYVFVKNDSGTYGLGLTTASQGQDLLNLNRKKRNKLFSAKGDNQTEQFLIQEGIPTSDTYSSYPIEPVIYGIGKQGISGFFRVHSGKSPYESLNAPGMDFSCLCLHKLDEPHESDFINCKEKADLVEGSNFLARFAALAAAKERQ